MHVSRTDKGVLGSPSVFNTVTEIWHFFELCLNKFFWGSREELQVLEGSRRLGKAGSLKGWYCVWVWSMLPELISHSNSVGKMKYAMKWVCLYVCSWVFIRAAVGLWDQEGYEGYGCKTLS